MKKEKENYGQAHGYWSARAWVNILTCAVYRSKTRHVHFLSSVINSFAENRNT